MIRQYRLTGQPIALPRQRFTRTGHSYKPAPYMKRKEADVLILRSSHLGDAIGGPIKMVIEFFHKRPKRLLRAKDRSSPIPKDKRPDIDNLSKHVLDVLQVAKVMTVSCLSLGSITGVLGGTNLVSCSMSLSYCVCDFFLVLLGKSQIIFAIMPI